MFLGTYIIIRPFDCWTWVDILNACSSDFEAVRVVGFVADDGRLDWHWLLFKDTVWCQLSCIQELSNVISCAKTSNLYLHTAALPIACIEGWFRLICTVLSRAIVKLFHSNKKRFAYRRSCTVQNVCVLQAIYVMAVYVTQAATTYRLDNSEGIYAKVLGLCFVNWVGIICWNLGGGTFKSKEDWNTLTDCGRLVCIYTPSDCIRRMTSAQSRTSPSGGAHCASFAWDWDVYTSFV